MRLYLLFLMMVSVPMPAYSFYKCVDASGAVTYQKIPCANAAAQKKMHVYVPPKPGLMMGQKFSGDESDAGETPIAIQDKLSTILSSLAPVRTAVLEHYQSKKEWPETLSDLGMNEAEMTSSYIDVISFDGSGKISTHLNKGFGENKLVVSEPVSVMGGTSFEWSCYANFPEKSLVSGKKQLCESRVIK